MKLNKTPMYEARRRQGPLEVGIESIDGDQILSARDIADLTGLPIIRIQTRLKEGTIRGFKTGHASTARWRARLSDVYKAFPGLKEALEPNLAVNEYELDSGEYELGSEGLKQAPSPADHTNTLANPDRETASEPTPDADTTATTQT